MKETHLHREQGKWDWRWLYLLGWCLLCLGLFRRSVMTLVTTGLHDENISHVFLIPLIAAWLLFYEKKPLPQGVQADRYGAAPFALAALLLAGWSRFATPNEGLGPVTVPILALVLLAVGGFVYLFGRVAARDNRFALGFFLFAVPLPPFFLQRFIYWLQAGSAAVAEFFFELSGYPVMRQGFVFRLPRISIEVAKECSGIRSSIALLILAVLVCHFSFERWWKKAAFIAAGLAMMLIKNGIRIATLTLLANYVNPDFLYGRLHHQGGVVFFLIGLALMIPVYVLLRRGEGKPPLASIQNPA